MNKPARKQPPPDVPRLVSVEELAAAWSLTEATVRRYARDAEIPAIKVGKSWRFRLEDLHRLCGEGVGR